MQTVGLIKKDIVKMSKYFPEPNSGKVEEWKSESWIRFV